MTRPAVDPRPARRRPLTAAEAALLWHWVAYRHPAWLRPARPPLTPFEVLTIRVAQLEGEAPRRSGS